MPTTNRRGKSKALVQERERGYLSPEQTHRFKAVISQLYARGWTPQELAHRMERKDKTARAEARAALWTMLHSDVELQNMMADQAKARMVLALPAAAEALADRARRGRPDAIKLLFAATGFYDPRLRHNQHSGEVKITVSIPRPTTLIDPEKDVVDAEVVED
jgi:hypothetical protein